MVSALAPDQAVRVRAIGYSHSALMGNGYRYVNLTLGD